jgi:hypothetical protein
MTKQLLSVAVSLAVVSQGTARADEAAPAAVTRVHDRAALAEHIDTLQDGDQVAVATDDGIISGEVVDKDADDLVIDQPLIQGGAERVTIPRHEIQGVAYRPLSVHQGRVNIKALVTVAVVVGIVVGAAAWWARGLGGP